MASRKNGANGTNGRRPPGRPKGSKDVAVRARRKLKTYDDQLDHKHFLVVEYYMQGCTKEESCLKAGYSKTFARKKAFTIFAREDVQREIEKRRWKIRHRSHDVIDRIKEELGRIAFFNIGHIIEVTEHGELVFDFKDVTMEQMAAIGEVSVETYMEGKQEIKRVKVKPIDKKSALDSLARIYGLFKDNLTVNPGEQSLEEKLAAGRARVSQAAKEPDIDGEFEEVKGE